MPTVTLPYRLIVSRGFFDKVMLKDGSTLFSSLMHITSKSKEFKKNHNLISEKIRKDILEKNPKYNPEFIKASLNKINEPEDIEDIEDEATRNIKYAIYYSKSCILISEDEKKDYIENKHLEGISDVIIKSDEDAIDFVENMKKMVYGLLSVDKDIT